MLLDPGVIFLHCVYAYSKLPHFSGVMRGLSCETVVSRDMRHYIIILYIIMRHEALYQGAMQCGHNGMGTGEYIQTAPRSSSHSLLHLASSWISFIMESCTCFHPHPNLNSVFYDMEGWVTIILLHLQSTFQTSNSASISFPTKWTFISKYLQNCRIKAVASAFISLSCDRILSIDAVLSLGRLRLRYWHPTSDTVSRMLRWVQEQYRKRFERPFLGKKIRGWRFC